MSIITATSETITVARGAHLRYVILLKDEDGNVLTDNLTAWSAAMTVRRAAGDATALQSWTTAGGDLAFNNTLKMLSIEPDDAVTAPVGRHVWDVKITKGDGTVVKSAVCPFIVTQPVTT